MARIENRGYVYGAMGTKQHVIEQKYICSDKYKGGNFKRSVWCYYFELQTQHRHLAVKVKSNANNNGGVVIRDVFWQFCLFSTFLNDFNGSAGKKERNL